MMCKYPPSTKYRYVSMSYTQIIQMYNTHRYNTITPSQILDQARTHHKPSPPDTTHTAATQTQTHVPYSPCPNSPPIPLQDKHIYISQTPLPKYITLPPCLPIGRTSNGMGSSRSLGTIYHALQQIYLRPLIHTIQNFKWSR